MSCEPAWKFSVNVTAGKDTFDLQYRSEDRALKQFGKVIREPGVSKASVAKWANGVGGCTIATFNRNGVQS
jgi:hypothetical protein